MPGGRLHLFNATIIIRRLLPTFSVFAKMLIFLDPRALWYFAQTYGRWWLGLSLKFQAQGGVSRKEIDLSSYLFKQQVMSLFVASDAGFLRSRCKGSNGLWSLLLGFSWRSSGTNNHHSQQNHAISAKPYVYVISVLEDELQKISELSFECII